MTSIEEQHIQFGEEIAQNPTKPSVGKQEPDSQYTSVNEKDVEVAFTPHDDSNIKKKQEYKGWVLIWLAYQSTGVIYGDIGTSPLYVYSSTFTSQPSYEDLLGALSIIIWSLTIMVTIKYVCIVLLADDDGEGGTFALYSLLARHVNIVKRDPNDAVSVKMERALTGDLRSPAKNIRSFMEKSTVARLALRFMGVLGVSMVMADGVLTPAQSILGAIQGIEVVHPTIGSGTIVGVSCAIIILLFAVQPFGVHRIGSAWAPIVVIWLMFNFCVGIYNLTNYDHSVLKAFSPYFAGAYFMRNKTEGWRSLGGLLLAFTGVEALFADLGAFSARSIRLSWLLFVYPCLLLAYIGQAAYISQDRTDAYTNPFFNTLPPHTLIFGLIIAVLAAIVASQAMITSSFQLLAQVQRLSYFPHIKTVHTSKKFHGQIYMPLANWLLMIGTIIVTAAYSNTTRIGNAYGVCVIFVTFITTCMVSLVAIVIWRINIFIVIFLFLTFAAFDGVYLTSALAKVPTGAWFTIMLALILSSIFILWRFGKEQQWSAEAADRFPTSSLLTAPNHAGEIHLTDAFGGHLVSQIAGMGIFFDKIGDGCPIIFSQFVSKFSARPEVMVFFHLRPLSLPTIAPAERYVIQRTSIQNCYRVTVRHGYGDDIVTPDLAQTIVEQLTLYITRDHTPSSGSATSADHSPEIQRELAILNDAHSKQIVYVLGKEQMKIRRGTNIFRRVLLEAFLWIRENSRNKMQELMLPTDQLVEVGFIKEI